MEHSPGVAYLFDEASLDVHMDILELFFKLELALFYLLPDGDEPHDNQLGVLFRDDALLPQHAGMRDGACDVVPVQALIERHRDSILFCQLIQLFTEAISYAHL